MFKKATKNQQSKLLQVVQKIDNALSDIKALQMVSNKKGITVKYMYSHINWIQKNNYVLSYKQYKFLIKKMDNLYRYLLNIIDEMMSCYDC